MLSKSTILTAEGTAACEAVCQYSGVCNDIDGDGTLMRRNVPHEGSIVELLRRSLTHLKILSATRPLNKLANLLRDVSHSPARKNPGCFSLRSNHKLKSIRD